NFHTSGVLVIDSNACLNLWKSSGSGTSGDPFIIQSYTLARLVIKDISSYTRLVNVKLSQSAYMSEWNPSEIINSVNIEFQSAIFNGSGYRTGIALLDSSLELYSSII